MAASLRILVVNAGSSSVKLRMLDARDALLASRDFGPGPLDPAALEAWIDSLGAVDAVGHRIVHGGRDFRGPVVIDARVEERLRALVDLAPLHQPASVMGMDAVSAVLPHVPAVACFDTAFHAGMPEEAATYAIPAEWRAKWGLRRFGFHGISHAYAARRTAELLGRDPADPGLRVVTCHLGAGASLAAVAGGRSIDTTMGFTPLEGLVMATRSGTVDPGLVLWLQTHGGLTAPQVTDGLEHRSGLAGLAGTPDAAAVLQRADAGDAEARLAVAVTVHRLRGQIAAMAAALGGLDALAFTGGVGEHAPALRQQAAEGLAFLGVGLDHAANATGTGDREIGRGDAAVRALVIAAREDLEIAREVRRLLG